MIGAFGISSRKDASLAAQLPVYPKSFGVLYDGSTDDTAAWQRAANYAILHKRPLHLGSSGISVISGSINISGQMTCIGDSTAAVIVTLANAPIFLWDTNGEEIVNSLFGNITLRGQFGPTAPYELSRAIKIVGDGEYFFQFNRFENIAVESLHTAFEIDKGTFATPFGLESRASFNGFMNVSVRGGSRPCMIGWDYRQGSGTGNTWDNLKTNLGEGAATGTIFRFGGVDCVVGDLLVDGHFGGAEGTAILETLPGTAYRQNITITGQADAGATVPFKLATDLPKHRNVHFLGVNVGGSATLEMPPTSATVTDDFDTDYRRAGNFKEMPSPGAFSVPIFQIDFGDELYTGVHVELKAFGLVGGVAGGSVIERFLISRSGLDATSVAEDGRVASDPSPAFFDFTVEPYATGAIIKLLGAPPSAGSRAMTQIACSGDNYSLRRL